MHKYLALTLLWSVIWLAGCAHLTQSPVASSDGSQGFVRPAESPPWESVVELETHILAGELAMLRGQSAHAAREYVAALKYSDDPALARRAARIALYANELELAYRAARVWAAGEPDSLVAQRTATRLALIGGTDESLQAYAQRVVALNAEGPGAGLRSLAQVLSGQPERAQRALSVMAMLVDAHAQLAEAHYAYALLAMGYQASDVAQAQVRHALALHPDWPPAILVQAEMLVAQGRTQTARKLIAGLGDTRDERVQFQMEFARLVLEYGYSATAAAAFERVLALNPENRDARYGLALLALTLHQPERATKALTRLHEAGYRPHEVAFYLGNIAERQQDYATALRWYKQVDGGEHQQDARVQALVMRAHLGDMEEALAQLRALENRLPGQSLRLIQVRAGLLLRANRLDDALAIYNQALQNWPGDPGLLYGRSLVYVRLGAIEKAMRDLHAVLAVQPNSPSALNALGYMLSNHSTRYQEALGYVRRALQARPQDPAIMDSLGWIHYRMGHLDKARELLTSAYEQMPDPEVAAHLGEVLWKLGEKKQAHAIWQRALEGESDAQMVRETVKRLVP